MRLRGWPSGLSALAVMAGAGGVVAGLIATVVPAVAHELDDLGDSARQGVDDVLERLTAGPLGLSEQQMRTLTARPSTN